MLACKINYLVFFSCSTHEVTTLWLSGYIPAFFYYLFTFSLGENLTVVKRNICSVNTTKILSFHASWSLFLCWSNLSGYRYWDGFCCSCSISCGSSSHIPSAGYFSFLVAGSTSQVKIKIVCTYPVLLDWQECLTDSVSVASSSLKSVCYFSVTLLASSCFVLKKSSALLCSWNRRTI